MLSNFKQISLLVSLDSAHRSRFVLAGSSPKLGTEYKVLSTDFGGADRDRTGDLLLAKQALSQLSYSPLK